MLLVRLVHWAGLSLRSVCFIGLFFVAILIALTWSAWPRSPPNQPLNAKPILDSVLPGAVTPADEGSAIRFRDLASLAGINFRHEAGYTEMHYFPEVMGGGVAWIDYDQDGYMDLLFVQGGKFPPDISAKPPAATSRLFR